MKTKKLNIPDLTQRPPRSPRVRLGGYAILARCLDKGRATLAGKNGEYNYACPLDENWFNFAGIKPAELKKQLAGGKGDGEILAWIAAHSTTKPPPWQIATASASAAWSGVGGSGRPSSVPTIFWTCRLPAPPEPQTAILIACGV